MAINKNKVMEAARKAVEKGQLDKAIKEYLKIVREDPKNLRVWLKVGDLYAKKGAKPEATETYLKVAKFYSEQGFYLKAVAVYKQILKLDPRMVEVNLKLAELYRQLGLLSDAMQHFEMVAAFFHREGKTKEALATIRQLVELDPENVATRIKLAELYSKENMLEEAATEFEHACDFLRRHHREDDFIKVAERLLWHKSENVALARELAGLYLKRNDPRRALQKLQGCFKADPRDVETLALLAQAFQALDQKGKTVSVLKELARILTENNQRSEAEEVHRKILAFVPDDPDSRAFLGLTSRPERKTPPPPLPANMVETPPPTPPPIDPESLSNPAPAQPAAPAIGRPTGSVPLVDTPVPALGHDTSPQPMEEDLVSELSLDDDSVVQDAESSVGGEVHSDEIVKILTETDVYVRYGLHQKAIDHLRKVFTLDPTNVEARERLKGILLNQGREGEAIEELLILAEQFAPTAPARARDFLVELLSLDAGCSRAFAIAEKHGIDIGLGGEEPVAEVELIDDDEAIEIDADASSIQMEVIDDDAFPAHGADGNPRPVGSPPPQQLHHPDMVVPAPMIQPAPQAFDGAAVPPGMLDDMPFDPEDARAFDAQPGVDTPAPMDFPVPQDVPDEDSIDGMPAVVAAPAAAPVDAALPPRIGEVPPGAPPMETIQGHGPGVPLPPAATVDEPLPFDPEDARAFDADVGARAQSEEASLDAEPLEFGEGFDLGGESDIASDIAAAVAEDTDASASASGLEDELDEADFFVSQGLYSEAREILEGLLQANPNHPLILAKLRDVDAMVEEAPETPETDMVAAASDTAAEEAGSKPAVLLEKPIDDEDADTHYDLGLAYKEMGLYDEAVKAFQKVLGNPGRQVQCHLMIGLCQREQGNLSEAINQFKAGLYVDSIREPEKFGLYYEIGTSYEQLNDPQEGMYYYEMILKKDQDYRDVASRVSAIQARYGDVAPRSSHDDTDSALDQVVAETQTPSK